jgi:YidC/Oxa1 family membrane protein insertase
VLSQLLGSVSLTPGAIPIWSQYVTFLEEVLDFLARTFNSGGIAIIVFTIIVKTLLLPLTIKAIRSSKNMQELQPKIKELQKKYGKDRQRLSQETMALYQQYQINPLAGCLPMVIQIPIFFGVYRAIANLSSGNVEGFSGAWTQGFLWLDSLDASDPYKILPIAAGLFQFVQTRMSRPAGMGPATDPQQRMMNTMMNFMPLMVVVFGWTFASGPVIYWVTQSVYSVVQQWLITGFGAMKDWFPWLPDLPEKRQLGYRAPRDLDAIAAANDGKPAPQGKFMGWAQKKAEEAQEQRTRMEAERAKRAGGSGANGSQRAGGSAKGGKKRTIKPKMAESDLNEEIIEAEVIAPVAAPKPVKQSARTQAQMQAAEDAGLLVDEVAETVAAPAPKKIKRRS